jgi:hypothetical protein
MFRLLLTLQLIALLGIGGTIAWMRFMQPPKLDTKLLNQSINRVRENTVYKVRYNFNSTARGEAVLGFLPAQEVTKMIPVECRLGSKEQTIDQEERLVRVAQPQLLGCDVQVRAISDVNYSRGFELINEGDKASKLTVISQQNALKEAEAQACASDNLSKARAALEEDLGQLQALANNSFTFEIDENKEGCQTGNITHPFVPSMDDGQTDQKMGSQQSQPEATN